MSVGQLEPGWRRDAVGLPSAHSRFVIGYEVQRQWAWLIAFAFFFGGVGAGTFAVSFADQLYTGMVLAILIVGVLKTAAHVLFLGHPLRAWRAVRRWRTSWISRGIIAISAFLIFASLYVLPFLGLSILPRGSIAHEVFGWVALVGAVVVMAYDGFVLKTSGGIPIWNSMLMPVLGAAYGVLGGITVTLVVGAIVGVNTDQSTLQWLAIGLLLANLVLIAVYVRVIGSRSAAARVAAAQLLQGPLRVPFLFVAVGTGLGATLIISALSTATGSVPLLAIGAATDLIGHFVAVFAILRSGTYRPLRPVGDGRIVRPDVGARSLAPQRSDG